MVEEAEVLRKLTHVADVRDHTQPELCRPPISSQFRHAMLSAIWANSRPTRGQLEAFNILVGVR